MKKKLNSLEKKWILYDVANSAFILLVTTAIPIFFNTLAKKDGLSSSQYLSYWGTAVSIATLLSGILGPFIGKISDRKGFKNPIFIITIIIGSLGCLLLGFVNSWLSFLLFFILSRIAFSLSLVLYDSMLIDITDEDRMDDVSSQGFAWGYIGSVIPFIFCILFLLKYEALGMTYESAEKISLLITSLWWILLSLPLVKAYQHKHYTKGKQKSPFKELKNTLKEVVSKKEIFIFLIAFFFYIDSVQTIINMATTYGKALGLDSVGLLIALLVTQLVAFPSTLILGNLSKNIDSKYLISICIFAYLLIVVVAINMTTLLEFWILAISVGLVQGSIQALSRSYYAKLIPKDKSGAYFGLYDIFGKGASFVGALTISLMTSLTNNPRIAIASIALFLILGFFLFHLSIKEGKKERNIKE